MKCVSGYSLVNNLCLQSLILGCEFEENDVCGKCAAPFHKVKDHCEIKDCASYNEYGCVACECGFYLTNEGKCKELASGCIRYQRGVCSDCQPHFTLKNSKC